MKTELAFSFKDRFSRIHCKAQFANKTKILRFLFLLKEKKWKAYNLKKEYTVAS